MADPVRAEDIEALVARFDASDCVELHIRFDGFELHLSRDPDAGGLQQDSAVASPKARPGSSPPPAQPVKAADAPAAPPAPAAEDIAGLEIVRAPYLGTFYRAPKPGEAAYVELGADVTAESELCLVEVMKLFTAVRAGAAGRVARIFARDGAMVEAGQPLFGIEPRG